MMAWMDHSGLRSPCNSSPWSLNSRATWRAAFELGGPSRWLSFSHVAKVLALSKINGQIRDLGSKEKPRSRMKGVMRLLRFVTIIDTSKAESQFERHASTDLDAAANHRPRGRSSAAEMHWTVPLVRGKDGKSQMASLAEVNGESALTALAVDGDACFFRILGSANINTMSLRVMSEGRKGEC